MKIEFQDILNRVFSKYGNAFFYTPPIYKEPESFLFENYKYKKDITTGENLVTIDEVIRQGYQAYGFLHYELGYELEEKLRECKSYSRKSLGKFFFFKKESITEINSKNIDFSVEGNGDYSIDDFEISVSKKAYKQNIARIKDFIRQGDTYQVNYTVPAEFTLIGSIEAVIRNMIFNQSAKYIAVINTYPEIIISISPELFFSYSDDVLKAKPMKGTIKRGINIENDHNQFKLLTESEKDRAENVMIVDLLRNDMGKISDIDSVKVVKRFDIEKYETVYQMTSTIRSRAECAGFSGIIKNLFPCGSVTGAPKIRTMEIIRELENYDRGIYTGTIGMILNNRMTFNVPIRTIVFNTEKKSGKIPIGSGIVWDSNAEQEYREIKLKAEFLTNPQPEFELLETMLVKGKEIFLFDYHLNRISEAADYFLFNFDTAVFKNILNDAVKNLNKDKSYKLRVTVNKWGKIDYSIKEISNTLTDIKIAVLSKQVDETDRFQYFKTTNREIYNEDFSKYNLKGYYDVLYFNNRDELAEGAINNVIVNLKGKLYTPPVSSGILNGCYRQYMMEKGQLKEKVLYRSDLMNADEVYLCNSVRGLVKVDSIKYEE